MLCKKSLDFYNFITFINKQGRAKIAYSDTKTGIFLKKKQSHCLNRITLFEDLTVFLLFRIHVFLNFHKNSRNLEVCCFEKRRENFIYFKHFTQFGNMFQFFFILT